MAELQKIAENLTWPFGTHEIEGLNDLCFLFKYVNPQKFTDSWKLTYPHIPSEKHV